MRFITGFQLGIITALALSLLALWLGWLPAPEWARAAG